MIINRKDFLTKVAERIKCSDKDVETFFKGFVDELCEQLRVGNKVALCNFGSFFLREHAGHPTSLGSKHIEEYNVFKFEAADKLKREFRHNNTDKPK